VEGKKEVSNRKNLGACDNSAYLSLPLEDVNASPHFHKLASLKATKKEAKTI